jgi:hypothetical protein
MFMTKNYNGSITLSDIRKGYRVKQIYFLYTLSAAKKAFKQYLKTLK